MKRITFLTMLTVGLMFAMGSPAVAKDPTFVGVEACGKCHKKEKQGEQLKIWEESKHSKAYEALGTPKAKERAAKVGVTGDPQKSEACLVCHTTGYGEPAARFDKKFDMKNGVQCESCHGAGSEYKKKKTMQAIYKELGPDNKGDSPTAKETGFVVANSETCKTCHTEERTFKGKTFKNPSFEPFDFDKRYDKIKHPVPK